MNELLGWYGYDKVELRDSEANEMRNYRERRQHVSVLKGEGPRVEGAATGRVPLKQSGFHGVPSRCSTLANPLPKRGIRADPQRRARPRVQRRVFKTPLLGVLIH